MKRTTLIYVMTTALAMFGLLGCGTTNKLQSVELSPTGNGGFINLQGVGAKIQFQVLANYTNKQSYDMTNKVTYTVTPTGTDVGGFPLPTPPQTVLMSPTGLITAVEPFVCTWDDQAPLPTDPPAWFLSGSYKVVATFKGVDSNPVFVAVASASGNGPGNACGPSGN